MFSANHTPTQGKIVSIIARLANQEVPLKLTRFYQGLLLSQEVRILSVFQDSAVLQAGDITLLSPSEECYFQLHHPLLDRPVRARLHHCSFDNCTFVLSDFTYLSRGWEERSLDRVQPKIPTPVSLRCESLHIRANCIDINGKGIGVLAPKSLHLTAQIVPGKSILVDFPFSPTYRGKKIKGTVIYLSPVGHLLFRIGIQLCPDPRQGLLLESYVAQRKEEIIGELGRAFLRALEPRRVEDLYF